MLIPNYNSKKFSKVFKTHYVFLCGNIWEVTSYINTNLTFGYILLIQINSFVVYFNQLLGAVRIRKLVETLFFIRFQTFFFFLNFFLHKQYGVYFEA